MIKQCKCCKRRMISCCFSTGMFARALRTSGNSRALLDSPVDRLRVRFALFGLHGDFRPSISLCWKGLIAVRVLLMRFLSILPRFLYHIHCLRHVLSITVLLIFVKALAKNLRRKFVSRLISCAKAWTSHGLPCTVACAFQSPTRTIPVGNFGRLRT